MGFIDFTAGDKPTAAQFDEMFRQTVMKFASAGARNTALASVLAEGLYTDLADTDILERYDGAAWKILLRPPTDYTPVLAGTGWALGNGTVAGRYTQHYGQITFGARVVFGSTSTYGAANPTLTLPATASSNAVSGIGPRGNIQSTVFAAATYEGRAETAASTCIPLVFAVSGSFIIDSNISSTVPVTFAAGNSIYVHGTYEAA